MRITAMASPEGAREANVVGNTVASITTIAVTTGRSPPWIPKYPVKKVAALQMAKDTAREVAICSTGSLSPDRVDIALSDKRIQCQVNSESRMHIIQLLQPHLVA